MFPSKRQMIFFLAVPVAFSLSVLVPQGLRSSPQGAAVNGFVFLDDGPLTNADVFLVSDDPDIALRSYVGRSNDGGFYEISGGVPPGNYRVVVKRLFADVQDASEPFPSRDHGLDATQTQMMLAAKAERGQRGGRRGVTQARVQQLPAQYSLADRTILRLTVPEDGNQAADLYLTLADPPQIATAAEEPFVQ